MFLYILIQILFKIYKGEDGNIINIVDQRVEKLTPIFFYINYKSSLTTLTISAMKLAPNIRVNAVSPGPTLKNNCLVEKHFKSNLKLLILKKKSNENGVIKVFD